MYTADYFIKSLNMISHPEGGFYKEIYTSEENITSKELKVDSSSIGAKRLYLWYLYE